MSDHTRMQNATKHTYTKAARHARTQTLARGRRAKTKQKQAKQKHETEKKNK